MIIYEGAQLFVIIGKLGCGRHSICLTLVPLLRPLCGVVCPLFR